MELMRRISMALCTDANQGRYLLVPIMIALVARVCVCECELEATGVALSQIDKHNPQGEGGA